MFNNKNNGEMAFSKGGRSEGETERNKRRPVARLSLSKKCFSWRSEEAQLRASP
jgi:hypothetical protein